RPEDERAVLIVRPRGWHLDEKHVLVDGQRISASLFDLGLFAWHNATALAAKDRGPYFYIPKLQSMEEAALWNGVLAHIERELGLPEGQMKVTVLIETLPAVFEMDEILHALRERIGGLDRGPSFDTPNLQSVGEAARWSGLLAHIERELGLPEGQMKVTVLIETLPAVFEMDEILHALRERIVGLNCGRWDYIFSYIKTLR